jgi:tetratricopeptide (TPR) repeat protein
LVEKNEDDEDAPAPARGSVERAEAGVHIDKPLLSPPDAPAGGRHLTPLLLARLRTRSLEHGAIAREVLPHLLQLCAGCRERDREVERREGEVRHPDEPGAASASPPAAALWQRLAALPYAEQLLAVEADATLHTRGLSQLLLERSLEAAEERPQAAARLANLSLRVAGHLSGSDGAAALCDLQANSLASLGNARRLLGELEAAGDAFDAGRRLLARGTGDPWVEAQVLGFEATLRRDQRRLGEAVALLDRIDARFTAARQSAELGRDRGFRPAEALLLRAWCLYHLGHPEAAPPLIEQAAGLLGEGTALLGFFNRYGALCSAVVLGRVEDAQLHLESALRYAGHMGELAGVLRLLLHRAEARLELAAGDWARAEATLRHAAPLLARRCQGTEAALAWLELASLYLEEGDRKSLRQLADEIFSLVGLPELGSDQRTVLLLFRDGCTTGELTPEVVAAIAAELEALRRPTFAWWSLWANVLTEERGENAQLGSG